MANSKIYHVTHGPDSPAGSAPYYLRESLIQGGLFSPDIGDLIIVDDDGQVESYVDRTSDNVSGRIYYSIIG